MRAGPRNSRTSTTCPAKRAQTTCTVEYFAISPLACASIAVNRKIASSINRMPLRVAAGVGSDIGAVHQGRADPRGALGALQGDSGGARGGVGGGAGGLAAT